MKNEYEKLGFKKVYPDKLDKEYFFYKLNLKHSVLEKLHIVADIDSNTLSVFCRETSNKVNGRSVVISSKHDVCLYYDSLNTENINKIINWLKNGTKI